MTPPHDAAAPAQAPAHVGVPAWRLILVLGMSSGLAGLLMVLVYTWTLPSIERQHAAETRAAIYEVLKDAKRFDTLLLYNNALVEKLPAGVDEKKVDHIYAGYDAAGQRAGFAIVSTAPGFQDDIQLIFGYDPTAQSVMGMKVLSSKETPGLGDKIMKDRRFIDGFVGALAPIAGVKGGVDHGGDKHKVDMITGATISSRAVIRIINGAVEKDQPLLQAYMASHPAAADDKGTR